MEHKIIKCEWCDRDLIAFVARPDEGLDWGPMVLDMTIRHTHAKELLGHVICHKCGHQTAFDLSLLGVH